MPLLGRSIATAGLVLASGLSLSACATEDYVDKQVATVNDRVSALEARVNTVDQTAQQANTTAQARGLQAARAGPAGRLPESSQRCPACQRQRRFAAARLRRSKALKDLPLRER